MKQEENGIRRFGLPRRWLFAALTAAVVFLLSILGYKFWQFRELHRGERAKVIQLRNHFNASLREPWTKRSAQSLAALPTGYKNFGGIRFYVGTGLIQVSSRELSRLNPEYPTNVLNIPVAGTFSRLHLLHGAVSRTSDGSPAGLVVLRYDDGKEESIMFNYGYHFREFSNAPNTKKDAEKPPKSVSTVLAWSTTNATSRPGESQRLFRTTFPNPRPKVEVKSMDYVSAMSSAAPFLVALSID